jgi:hypothetical protein
MWVVTLQRVAFEELEHALGLKKNAMDAALRSSKSHSSKGAAAAAAVAAAPAEYPEDEPDEAEVARQFGLLDSEGTGFIATAQLQQLMAALGIALNPAQLTQAKQQLDKDSFGKISYGEFLLWWSG